MSILNKTKKMLDTIFMVGLLLLLLRPVVQIGKTAVHKGVINGQSISFQNVKAALDNAVHDYFEEKYHASNSAAVTIGDLKEINSLEVLNVSDSWCKITEDVKAGESERWVKFDASGVYVVELNQIDCRIEDNKVYVSLPSPKLTNIRLSDKPVIYHYQYKKGFLKTNGDYDTGSDEFLSDETEAKAILCQQLKTNTENDKRAMEEAEHMIKAYILNVNSEFDMKSSDIEVEFI